MPSCAHRSYAFAIAVIFADSAAIAGYTLVHGKPFLLKSGGKSSAFAGCAFVGLSALARLADPSVLNVG
ncbi:hypothetical protein RGR602_CH03140 [Rhizobium gallicum bv. gallicum R602sp]|uniref:Uncharacterized protein n=1 Tax=Rhizobium gallicum bv. gallicum R602sp TaxID=1041138 RepID=A0A0B4X7L6_9HYPH|nr:hypothetical protein RGR602_CH03140 [Rhizobium gallicum bv. gallicum R602sp]